MFRSRSMLTLGAVAFTTLALNACSGSDSATAGIDASNTTSSSDLLSNIDEILAGDSTSATSKLVSHRGGAGDFSVAGCMLIQDRGRARTALARVANPLCYISKAEAASAFTIPVNEYGIFKVVMPAGMEKEGEDFRVRMQKTDADGKKCLKFQACKDRGDGLKQNENFEVCEADGGVTVDTQHTFSDSHDGHTFSGADSLSVTAKGADKDNLSEVVMEALFKGSDGGTFGHRGNVNFTHSATDGDTILAGFDGKGGDPMDSSRQFSHSGWNYTLALKGDGATHAQGTDGFPSFLAPDTNRYCPGADFNSPPVITTEATCTREFDHTQAFTLTDGKPVIVDSASSSFYADVAAFDLSGKTLKDPNAFKEEWDCSGEITATIDFTNVNVDDCMAQEEKLREVEDKLNENCFDADQREHQPGSGS